MGSPGTREAGPGRRDDAARRDARRLAVVGRHPVAAFFVLSYALAWGWWIPLALADRGWFTLPWTSHVPGLVAPLVAALLVAAATGGRPAVAALARRMVAWRVGPSAFAWAVTPLLLFALAAAVVAPFVGSPAPGALGRFVGVPDVGPVGLWLVLVVVNGLGEEAGWRGFAHDRLAPRVGFRRSVEVVAVLWAGWHLPLFLFHEGFAQIPRWFLPGWFVGIAAGAVVLAWLYDRTGGSILVVAVWHGSYNWAAATEAADGAIGAMVTAAVIAAALVLTRRASRPAAPPGGRPRGRER